MTIVASNNYTISNVSDGTILHTAYAYSTDGTDRFSTSYPGLNWVKGTQIPISIIGNNTVNQGGSLYLFDDSQLLSNQDFVVGDSITFEFDWKTIDPSSGQSGTFTLQWNENPWWFNFPQEKLSSLTTSGHAEYTLIARTADKDNSAVATGIGYRLDNVPASTTLSISNLTVRKTAVSEPWMPSASEVTTADYPAYAGQYTDFTQGDSTNPSDYTWSLIRGNDGKDGNNGNDGIAGKDGTGIKTTTITYAGSTIGTTAPTSGWTATVPTVAAGSYLWTKTVWAYTDNTSETGYSVAKMGSDGAIGPQGLKGEPGTPGSTGPTGAPGQIYQQDTEPTTKVVNMLWQYTGTTTITASGATIAPSNIYVWTGTTWILWSITVANLIADKLSSIVSTLGDVTSGSITNEIHVGSNNGGNDVLDTGTVVIDKYGITLNWDHLINSILDSSQQNSFGTEGLSFAKLDASGHVTKSISVNANSGIDVGDINGNSSTLTPTGIIVKGKDLSNTYSTSETAVGTWIDGKTIYSKTMSFSNLTSGSTQNISHGVTNLSHIIKIEGSSNSGIPINFSIISSNTFYFVSNWQTAGIISLQTSGLGTLSGYFTFYYTKTV